MPELPEVETVRRGLLKIAVKRKINAIDVYYGKTITNDVEDFRQALIGQTIENIDRRGKYLLFRFTNDLTMIHTFAWKENITTNRLADQLINIPMLSLNLRTARNYVIKIPVNLGG